MNRRVAHSQFLSFPRSEKYSKDGLSDERMKYSGHEFFSQKIEEYLKLGYQIHGSIQIIPLNNSDVLYNVLLIKYE